MDDKNPLKMKVTELKVELGRRGLSQTGLKFDLAQRLQTAMDVDEFGALPSLASSSSPSSPSPSPLLQHQVPGRDSADQDDSPAQSAIQMSSYEPTKGHATEKYPSEPEVVVEIEGIKERTVKSSEKAKSTGTPSTAVLDSPQSNINTPTLKKALSSEKGVGDENGANGDGSDKKLDKGILGDERKLEKYSEGDTKEKITDTKGKCDVTVMAEESMQRLIFDSSRSDNNRDSKECPRLFGEKAIVMPSSDYCDEKNAGTTEGGEVATAGEENTQLLPLVSPDSTSAPTSSPQDVGRASWGEKTHQTGEGAEDFDKNMTERRDGLAPDELKERDVNQTNDANRDGSSELPPGSLLLCTQAERMKGREARFRQEKKPEKQDKIKEIRVKDSTERAGVDCAQANCDGHDHGGKAGVRYSVNGGERGEGGLSSGVDASPEAPVAGSAEDSHKIKLMKRKERFAVAPAAGNVLPSKSKEIPCAKVDTLSAACTESKVSTGTVLEETGETASPRRRVASEAAAKLAKRAERFGVKRAVPCLPSAETSPANVRDPRGSFFAKADGVWEGNTKKQPPASDAAPGGYYFDPLPQRKKRARDTSAMSRKIHGATAKRRWVGAGDQADIAGAERSRGRAALGSTAGEAPRPGATATAGRNCHQEKQTTLEEVAKPRERRVSFAPAGRDGVDESRVREAAGNPSSGNNNATSTGSMLVLLGGVKPAPPKLSATAIVAAGEGASKRSRCLIDEGKEVSEQSQGRDKVKRVVTSPSKPSYSHGRGGGEGDESSSSRGSRVCRDNESKTKEQAAKMAKRRQRFAEDPRAPSFR